MLKNRLHSYIYFRIGLNTNILVRKRTVKYHYVTNISPGINHHVHRCVISNSLEYIHILFVFLLQNQCTQQDIHHESMSYSHTFKGMREVLNQKSEGEIWKMYGQYMKYSVVWKGKKDTFPFPRSPRWNYSFQQISAPVRSSATLRAIFRREDGIFYIQAVRWRFGI